MTTPIRIIRAKAQARNPAHFALTERQRVRQEAILDIARYLIASEGLANVTFVALARASPFGRNPVARPGRGAAKRWEGEGDAARCVRIRKKHFPF